MLRLYIEGSPSAIRIAHDALPGISNMTDEKGKPARWRLQLSDFDFEVVHRVCIKHQAVDVLSHLSTTRMNESSFDRNVPALMIPQARPKDLKTRRETKLWFSLPWFYFMDTMKPGLPEVLQVLDVTVN